jgi:Tol biopolymer transport system component/tRNA A-37 threonylcarbamoyl transferase component Bud32
MPLAPGARLGAYEILSLLGAGGMGEVYRARDTRLNRDVAIKVLPEAFVHDADRLARFKREAQVLASLNHPHICALYHIDEASNPQSRIPNPDRVQFLVLELVDGPTLADRIAQGPIPIDEALPIGRQIAEALEAAHEHGVVHRDLKPANIKLTSNGNVKVLDFGLAKAADVNAGSERKDPAYVLSQSPTITSPAMTMGGVILGTAAYMSPEQAKGKSVDKRSDIWAFGCVLYEMLTARRAFEGEDVSDTLAAILRGEPDWSLLPRELPDGIGLLLRRCLDKDRTRRVADSSTVLFILNEPALTTASGSRAVPPATKGSRTYWLLWAASIVAAIAMTAAGAMYLRPAGPVAPERRLSVTLPRDAGIAFVAISPDARRLALVMRAEVEGRQQIWLRSLDSHDFHALPGTSGSRSPFFSPDGRMLGFFADGKLKVVPVSGGPPRELCDDAGLGGGGTWSRDGVILFGGFTAARVLGRVNAEGGPCTEVTKSREGGFDIFPSFLPDGDHFVYVIGGEPATRGIYISSLRDPASAKRLLADFSSPIVAPPSSDARHGHLLFLRGTTLMAQPFNFTTMELVGDLFPAAVSVSPSSAIPQVAAAMSEDGVLVYLSSPRDSYRLTWIDRAGKELEEVTPASTLRGVALSPDERTVAYTRGQTLFLRDLARGVETPMGEGARSPLISPDGLRVAFSTGGLVGAGKLLIKEIASGKEETLPMQVSSTFAPSDWSRDGQYLLYTDIHPKTQGDIWAQHDPVNPRSGRKPMPFLVTNFNESQAQLSPDGRWVAYTSNESGEYAVYVTAFPSGSGKRRVSPAEAREPRWRRDGRELFFLGGSSIGGGRHRIMAVPVEITSTDISLGAATPLFEFYGRSIIPQGNVFQYAPGADGQRFLLNPLAANTEIALHVVTNWRPAVQ